jgi:hypothetical protein
MVQAGLVLGGLEAFLDRPARPANGDQLGQRGAARGVAGEERQFALALAGAGQGAASQQVTGGARGRDQRPVAEPGSLGSVTARDLLPPRRDSTARSTTTPN